jgi:NAD(P)-dependent dehydrogenase (short-subunit alcohol dehydrogenase family)
VLQVTEAPAATKCAGLAADGVVLIVDDETGIGEALAQRLGARGDRVIRVVTDGALCEQPGIILADLRDPEGSFRLLAELASRHERSKAFVYLTPLGRDPNSELANLLILTQGLRADLEAAAAAGGAAVLGATQMGGTFAVGADVAEFDPEQGTVPGFLKTLALEWPTVRVKAVDFRQGPAQEVADRLIDELMSSDGIVEVGYCGSDRVVLHPVPLPVSGRPAGAPLHTDSVILITGGARGITAEVAVVLAERYRPTLVLVGRTVPDDEDPATVGLTGLPDLRRAMYERRRDAGFEATPAAVERDVRRITSAREVRKNLARLRRTGARVDYLTCDVGDAAAFGKLIDGVYDTEGHIDGVIHGAGVIEDKLVQDKDVASLVRVVATKAGAASVLAARLRPETLRFVVFFSSVSGRFGNRGQADYAAASEWLNKLAQQLDRRWDARVVSINWGPWSGEGMVTPYVQRLFAARGVALIPVEVGCRRLEEELRLGRKGEVEVLIGSPGTASTEPPGPLLEVASSATNRADGGVEVVRRLDPEQDVYLGDHRLDGKPVLPFAVAMELMAETAAASRPELEVAQIRGIRLNSGIVVDRPDTAVEVVATPRDTCSPSPTETSLDVTLRTPEVGRPQYRATVELRARVAAVARPPGPLHDPSPFSMTVEDAYRAYLFHGPLFHGILEIQGMDEGGASALLRPSAPTDCLRDVTGQYDWILDPVLVDCALQMQVLWARLHWDVTLLPAQIESYGRIATPPAGREVVRHELRIHSSSQPPLCLADHWFFSLEGNLLATLTGVEGVGSRALNRLGGGRT